MTTVYLVRHGENERIAGDQPLNEAGRRQARAAARHLTPLPVVALYSSPLARCRQTAAALARPHGLAVRVDERLRERANFGDLPGQSLEEFIAMWRRCDRDREHRPEVGLSSRANGERLAGWLEEMVATHPGGVVIAASHGGTISDYLLNHFPRAELEGRLPGFPASVAHASITVLSSAGHGFRLRSLAATHHLCEE